MSTATIALLHLAPRAGEIERNQGMVEEAVLRASAMGATFIVSPELVVRGYGFQDRVGTEWIARSQQARVEWAAALARRAAAVLLLGTPEAEPAGSRLFNGMAAFAADGAKLGQHRKIAVLKVGSESWSTPGDRATAMDIAGIGRVGLFVCADMHSEQLVRETSSQGIDLVVSSAAWAPGHHDPNGEWERASVVTGRPVPVCNRTGLDVVDFGAARSVAVSGGSMVHSHVSPEESLVLVDWTVQSGALSNWRIAAIEG